MNWEEIHSKVPDLPADFKEFALDQFNGDHVLYYHGRGHAKKVFCPVCRETVTYSERLQIFPRSDGNGRCGGCGIDGTYLNALKVTRPTVRERYIFIGQKYDEDGFILRGFKSTLIERSPFCREVDSGEEEPMEIRLTEHRRLYILKDRFYKEYNDPKWECLFRSSSGYGICWAEEEYHNNWNVKYGDQYKKYSYDIYPGIYEEMQGTAAQYSMMERVFGADPEVDVALPVPRYTYYGQWTITVWDYLTSYAKDRKLEILLKCGLDHIAYAKLCGESIHYNPRAKNPWDYLKVTKERFRWLTEHNPGTRMLDLCRYERKHGLKIDDATIDVLGEAGISVGEFESFLRYMTPMQLANRLIKYGGKRRELRQAAITYRDTLNMRSTLGYDMTDSINTYPRDLKATHDALVIEQNAAEAEKRKKESEKKYHGIKERFKEAAVVYGFQEKDLLIRPAKSAAEIVEEGRKLHHCVGGDNYLRKHNNRITAILFIRHTNKPGTPYITVEIDPHGEIKQWYGIHDTKPDKKRIEMFLKHYLKQLNLRELAKEAKLKIAATEKVAI